MEASFQLPTLSQYVDEEAKSQPRRDAVNTVLRGQEIQPRALLSHTKGLDKILKKCGEECSEVIIAAKNGKQEDTVGELSDLLYHLTVLMVNEGIPYEAVEAELSRRHQKQGNLKNFHQVDKNT